MLLKRFILFKILEKALKVLISKWGFIFSIQVLQPFLTYYKNARPAQQYQNLFLTHACCPKTDTYEQNLCKIGILFLFEAYLMGERGGGDKF